MKKNWGERGEGLEEVVINPSGNNNIGDMFIICH